MKDFFSQSAFAKVLLLVALTLVLGLPLAHIGGLIDERGASRQHAAQELASSHAGQQVLVGPVLVVPYVERWTETELDAKGRVKSRTPRQREAVHLVFPEKMTLDGKLAPQQRYRGIFSVLFYDLEATLAGHFPPLQLSALPREQKDSVIEAQPAHLAFSVSDVRGIQGQPALRVGGEALKFLPGVPRLPQSSALAHGIHAPLPAALYNAWAAGKPLPYDLRLALVGQERFAVAPIADETSAHLASTWPHPSFGGKFLAIRRNVTDAGFQATWAVSSLVSPARAQVLAGVGVGVPSRQQTEHHAGLHTFDVSLVEPLNVYSLTDRAIKYGLLFIALTLMAAFMFELFRQLRLHPVQYGLVGLSIALFFLLLLALSEKIEFPIAYAGAAAASVLLLMVYFSAVLRGWQRGVGLGAFVGVLYAALYGLLASEDNALLLGSLLLFGLLALLMVMTRRVDWYAMGARVRPSGATLAVDER
jgi:inner membrane protein